ELESAVADLEKALKAYEHGYGWLANPAEMIDPLVYLGAISVLVGEPEKAEAYFVRAMNMPGRAVLPADVFPPNIQEVFEKVQNKYEESKKYSVKLISEPLGAEVYIDGRFAGTTPVLAEGLTAGRHLVRAGRDGYLPWGGAIRVSKERTRILKLKMRPAQRHAEFSARLRKLIRELMQGAPGVAAAEMGRFLGARELYLFWLSGPDTAVTLKGWKVTELDGRPAVAGIDEVLDTKSPSLEKSLDEIITRVLSLGTPEPVAGAEEAVGLGLDLGVEEEAAKRKGTESKEAAAGVTAEGEAKASPEKAAAEQVVEKTGPAAAPAERRPSWWAGLHRKWWFWTAVGVVVAGAAVGGYLGATAGTSGGGLVISLH
ncbi:MAG: PEGA domain-containing protein, partial [Deltaproteobacteria bacterium]